MREMFYWHTTRGFRYIDPYWQWIKSSDQLIEESVKGDERLEHIYRVVYTYGWQYDMGIIQLEDFAERMREVSEFLRGG